MYIFTQHRDDRPKQWCHSNVTRPASEVTKVTEVTYRSTEGFLPEALTQRLPYPSGDNEKWQAGQNFLSPEFLVFL